MFLAHQTLQFFTLHFPRSWLCRKPKRSRRPSGAKKGPVIGRQGAGNFSGELAGAQSPEPVNGWIDGANLELTPSDLAEIAMALKRSGAGSGPPMPNVESGQRQEVA
jgi:hypothetical protein